MAVSKYEVRAKKELVEAGWRVDDKRGMGRFSKNRDFWNLFDLCCLRPDKKAIHWISIKGRAGVPRAHLEEIKAFQLPENNIKEIWSRSQSKKRENYWHKEIIN